MTSSSMTWEKLERIVHQRAAASPDESWTARLLQKGVPTIARKVGEEAVETVVAALSDNEADVTAEAADLIFHLTVLLHARGLSVSDVMNVLEARQAQSGLAEKASRGD